MYVIIRPFSSLIGLVSLQRKYIIFFKGKTLFIVELSIYNWNLTYNPELSKGYLTHDNPLKPHQMTLGEKQCNGLENQTQYT